jgi:hypothetical protein
MGVASLSPAMKAVTGLLCLLLAGCATRQPPSPDASITFDCAPVYCSVSEADILSAVAGIGYPVKGITIIASLPYDCPVPEDGVTFPPCPPTDDPPIAYVAFVGTDKIAQVAIRSGLLGIFGDSVVSFDDPPGPDASF